MSYIEFLFSLTFSITIRVKNYLKNAGEDKKRLRQMCIHIETLMQSMTVSLNEKKTKISNLLFKIVFYIKKKYN